jgi:hypothetical protein
MSAPNSPITSKHQWDPQPRDNACFWVSIIILPAEVTEDFRKNRFRKYPLLSNPPKPLLIHHDLLHHHRLHPQLIARFSSSASSCPSTRSIAGAPSRIASARASRLKVRRGEVTSRRYYREHSEILTPHREAFYNRVKHIHDPIEKDSPWAVLRLSR